MGQSVLLAVVPNNKQCLRQIRTYLRIHPKCSYSPSIPAGMRIATPRRYKLRILHPGFSEKIQVSVAPLHRLLRAAQVRPGSILALARNDMQKPDMLLHIRALARDDVQKHVALVRL